MVQGTHENGGGYRVISLKSGSNFLVGLHEVPSFV